MRLLRTGTLSITARLTILYTFTSVAILLSAIILQFFALTNDLEFEDNDFLVDKIRVLQGIIARTPDSLEELRKEVQWEVSMRGYTRYMVRIANDKGATIIETAGMTKLLPPGIFPYPSGERGILDKSIKKVSSDGKTFLINSAWAYGPATPHYRLVQISLDISDEVDFLNNYRLKMVVIFMIGVIVSAALSVVVARRGLHPLEEITEKTEKITAAKLHERVSGQAWPHELTTLAVAFDGMLDRLESSFTRLSEFSSNLAHELRTPINNLMGETEIALSRRRTPEEYQQVLASGMEEYRRLSRMIDDILFLARAEKAFEPCSFAARGELELLIEFYRTLADDKGVTLTCTGEGAVTADPNLFQRVVGNLISNAIRYTRTGGTITITIEQVDNADLCLSIEDTGIGIPPDDLEKVFDRFFRTEQARTLHAEGTGLGLSIVKSIMELHGGSIAIDSTEGHGTRISLRFPHRLR